MKIYNSLTRKIEEFTPINPPEVGLYTCGPTVYDYTHIGHGRKYTNDDVLKRTLGFLGYKVKHVQNITDVGHLVSDSDEGEDKLEKGATKTGKTVWEVAEYFTKYFYDSMAKLNILPADITCKATDHIPEQIEMIKKLIEKGFAYDTPEAVYFDVSKFSNYGNLFGQKMEDKLVAVREDVETGSHKKNPADFSVWFKRVGRFENHTMHWESPWGDGFPGWHIECSAMSVKYLGEQFDIHTGGEDHISIHHPNEIAQSEASTGKSPFVKYWVHYAFITVDGQKMSKSTGNYLRIDDVEQKGFDPLALRYLYLTTHYKKPLNFTWEGLTGAQNTLNRLREIVINLKGSHERNILSEEKMEKVEDYRSRFVGSLSEDINTPQALAVLWEAIKSNIPDPDKYDLAISFDEVLGLGLSNLSNTEAQIPKEIQELMDKREMLRKEGKFEEADKIRDEVTQKGYKIKDKK